MRENMVKRNIAAGGLAVGTFVMEFNTPGIAAILGEASAEFAVYDMEHSGFDTGAVRSLMSYNNGLPLIPIVRVPETRYHFIARSLDAGAMGIMVPMVESGAQAKEIVQACKYPPLGMRGTTSGVAHDGYSAGDLAEKLTSANEQTLIIAQIETEQGVERIEEIVSTEGIDVAWVGHNDLSVSMGIPGQTEHPRVVAAMERVTEACRKYGKTAGRLVPDTDTGLAWIGRGYRMIAYSNDIKLLQSALKQGIGKLRNRG